VSADKPIFKINNPEDRIFFLKHTQTDPPDESALRKNYRIDRLKNKAPDTPIPPTPVITRWGTWSDAIVYYAGKFYIFCSVANEPHRDDAPTVEMLKDLFKDSN
jgi:hypothetical protein